MDLFLQLRLKLIELRVYWQFRNWRAKVAFLFSRFQYRRRESARSFEQESLPILKSFLRLARQRFVLALIVVFVLTQVMPMVPIKLLVPDVLLEYLFNTRAIEPGTYDTLLATIASVTGVFIGLYFTAVSTIAGAVYNRVPGNIRNLFLRERASNFYIALLVDITIVSLLLLASHALGTPVSGLAIPIIVLLSSVALYSFARLGYGIFQLFDPIELAHIPGYELIQLAREASVNGYRWKDPNFQESFRRKAQESISVLNALASLAQTEANLQRKSLIPLMAEVVVLLVTYVPIKKQMPSKSRWYRPLPRYEDWYLSDHSSLAVAHNTSTGIQPKIDVDRMWLEDDLFEIYFDSISVLLSESQWSVAANTVHSLAEEIQVFGKEWQTNYAITKLLKLIALMGDSLLQTEFADGLHHDYRIALAELMGILPINLLLGLSRAVQEFDTDTYAKRIAYADWLDDSTIYLLGIPSIALDQLEWLQERIISEPVAEGQVVTPAWYTQQLTFQRVAYQLQEQLSQLTHLTDQLFIRWIQPFVDTGQHVLAAAVISRGLEYCHKTIAHLSDFERLADALDRHRILPGLPWPNWNWEQIRDQIQTSERTLRISYAQLIPNLARFERRTQLPDYFGQAVDFTLQASFRALTLADIDLFRQLFPLYFAGSLVTSEQVRRRAIEVQDRNIALWTSQPVIDLVDLSGYAFLFAELHQEPLLWEICQQQWQRYFDQMTEFQEQIELLSVLVRHGRRSYTINSRALVRTNWHMSFNRQLAALPTEREVIGGGIIPHFRENIDHPSPFIRALHYSEHYGTIYEGADVFVAVFLAGLIGDFDFGGDHGFTEAVLREMEVENNEPTAAEPEDIE